MSQADRYLPASVSDITVNVPTHNADRFHWFWRLTLIGFSLGLITLLVIALQLTPNPRGFGTHRQLGLPECSFKTLFQVPCPSCGMTTSWSHMVRGRVISSFRANAGGAALAITAIVVGPWFLISGVRGRWAIEPPSEVWVVCYALGIVAVIIGEWVLRQFVLT